MLGDTRTTRRLGTEPISRMIGRVLRRLAAILSDEAAGLGLLYGVMRHGRSPIRRGPPPGVSLAELLSGNPVRLFGAAPLGGRTPRRSPRPEKVGRVTGCGAVSDFAFPTDAPTGDPENDTVRGRLWEAAEPTDPRRCVLALDGIVQAGFGNHRTFARTLCPAGIDLVAVDLPFNHRRTPDRFRPGQLILHGDLRHVLSVLRQAVRDVAAALRMLQEGGDYPGGVGLAGISFGGWVALQTAAVLGSVWKGGGIEAPRWVCGVCPAADLLLALTDGGAIVRAARGNLGLGSDDLPALADVAATIRPAAYPSPFPTGDGPNRVILHAAEYDRFVPNAAVERLAAAWGGDLTWHAAGHMGLAAAPPYLRAVAEPWLAADLWPATAARPE